MFSFLCSKQYNALLSLGKLKHGFFLQSLKMHFLCFISIIFSFLCSKQYNALFSLGKLKHGFF